jgi:hypothetical protein
MMVEIILPQAIKIVIPPLTNNCINVMKDTALASVVAMPDLAEAGNAGAGADGQPLAADRCGDHLRRAPVALVASSRDSKCASIAGRR